MGKALDGRNLGKGITQRKDGRYYARIRSNGKLIEMYDKNLEYLRARLNTVKGDNRCVSIGRGFTVEEWFEEWFDLYKAPVIKETSIAPMKNRVRNTILPYIGKKPLAELTNLEFQRVVSRLIMQNKISRSSIREAARRLDECFAAAVNNGLIQRNPAFGAAVPLDEKDVRERRFLSEEEIRIFLEEARDTWWYEMLYCMIHTGMRIGEISALCWSDIDWSNKRIKVRKNLATWYENGTKHESLTSPKTTNAYRVIPFMAEVET